MTTAGTRAAGIRLVNETLLGEALMSGSLPVVVTDESLRYVTVNDAACELLGYSRGDLLAVSVANVAVGRGESVVASLQRVAREGSATGTTAVRRADGTELELGYVSFATTIASMKHVVTVMWISG